MFPHSTPPVAGSMPMLGLSAQLGSRELQQGSFLGQPVSMMNRSPPFVGTGVPMNPSLAGMSPMGSPMLAGMRPPTGVLGPGLSQAGPPIIPMARMHPTVRQPAPILHAMSAPPPQPMMAVQQPPPTQLVVQQQQPQIQLVPSPPQIIQQPAQVQFVQQPAPVQVVQAPQPQYQVVQPAPQPQYQMVQPAPQPQYQMVQQAPLPVQVVPQQQPIQVLQAAPQTAQQPAQVVQVSPRGQPPTKVVHVVSNTTAKKPPAKVVYVNSQHSDEPVSSRTTTKVVYVSKGARNSSQSANPKVVYVDSDPDEVDYRSRHPKYKGPEQAHYRKNSYKMGTQSGRSPPSPSPMLIDEDTSYSTSTPVKPRIRRSSSAASTQTDPASAQPTAQPIAQQPPAAQPIVQQSATQPLVQQQPVQQPAQPTLQQPAQPIVQQTMAQQMLPSPVHSPITGSTTAQILAQTTAGAQTLSSMQTLDQTTDSSLQAFSQSMPQPLQQPLPQQQAPIQQNMQPLAQASVPQPPLAVPQNQLPPTQLQVQPPIQSQVQPPHLSSPPASSQPANISTGSSQVEPSALMAPSRPGMASAASSTSLNYMLPPQEPYPTDSYGAHQQQQQPPQLHQQNNQYQLSESMRSLNFTEDPRGASMSSRLNEHESSSITSGGAYSIHDDGYNTQDSTNPGHGMHHTSLPYSPQGYTNPAPSMSSHHPLLQTSYPGTAENIHPHHN